MRRGYVAPTIVGGNALTEWVSVRSAATTDGRGFPVLVDEQLSHGLPLCRIRGGYGRGVAAVLLVEDDETIGRVLAASLGVHVHAPCG